MSRRSEGGGRHPQPVWPLNKVIGQRLREHRKNLGLSQEQLARALARTRSLPPAWRNRQTVSAAERGDRIFSAEDLVGLAAFFGVPVPTLLDPAPDRLRPGSSPPGEVALGRIRLDAQKFHGFIDFQIPRSTATREPISPEGPGGVPTVVMESLGGPYEDRPWARMLRDGATIGEAYKRARDQNLENLDRKPPGPTVRLTMEGAVLEALLRSESIEAPIDLTLGETYTARDDLEAEYFAYLLDHGMAKRARARKSPPKGPTRGKEQ